MKNWIVADPEHLGGSPRVRGTRISVALILESLAAGLSVAEIVDAYPSLTEESVRCARKVTKSNRSSRCGCRVWTMAGFTNLRF
jgi:uncharacterized protein (DUF433 family)